MTPKSRERRTTEGICQGCHDMIHVLYPNRQQKADPSLAKYLTWISRRGTHPRYGARRSRRR
ncbi:MAG TPA: hypothetical protein DCG12_23905 [Planctomycetaceae bacterium]|nr:hypothetical protein [Planctomycetaceae bacterium]